MEFLTYAVQFIKGMVCYALSTWELKFLFETLFVCNCSFKNQLNVNVHCVTKIDENIIRAAQIVN